MLQRNRISNNKYEECRWPYYLILPFSWILVFWVVLKKQALRLFKSEKDVGLLIFDGIGKYGKVIKRNVTGWKAVDLIYNHQFGNDRSLGGMLDDFWFGSLNCQAARNRFKLAKIELENAVRHFSNEKEVKVASLAAGTGQIETEVIAKFREENVVVRAVLVDREKAALSRAQEFILLNNLQGQVSTVHASAARAVEKASRFKPHIVHMIAFLDYLPDGEAVKFVSKIYKSLPTGGFLIASNTMPNVEMHFVKWVVGWPLIYRKAGQIAMIISKSGFTQYRVIPEPLQIQGVVVARK
jgi:hypothetical protein